LFEELEEIYVLVPALLGLKGNLEMTLASRFSTQVCLRRTHVLDPFANKKSFIKANLGYLSTKKDILRAILGNLLLTQVNWSCFGTVFDTSDVVCSFFARLKP
jgi:solute carrier family 41